MTERNTEILNSPTQLELEKIWKLHPQTVIVGLNQLIHERLDPLVLNWKETPEEEYIQDVYFAVSSLIDPLKVDLKLNDKYKSALERTIRYMRFIGFPESKLTAQSIVAAEEELNREIMQEPIDFESWKTSQRTSEPLSAQERLKAQTRRVERKNRLREIETERDSEDQAVLAIIDGMMNRYKRLPSLEKYINRKKRELPGIIKDWTSLVDFATFFLTKEEIKSYNIPKS